ncbi:hypothetical protein JD844_009502 [Phrynosoma platyrhinos]|uniref:Bcl-2 Bcl-2 homology region 1-3 domain-containing protein n=1 Tax=Phrynosoma platyrhinos TaxID=52577 RepID=A0ABQ7TFJ0_PHRPL|nr:hypothetical protein JD844_009502 [Phrynosoma platyrhinos]
MEKQTFSIVHVYLNLVCGQIPNEQLDEEIYLTLQKIANLTQKHLEEKLEPLIMALDIPNISHACEIIQLVIQSQFSDGKTNWGRIVVVLLFGGVIAKKLKNNVMSLTDSNVQQITDCIAGYLIMDKHICMKENGSWVHVAKEDQGI